MREGQRSKKYEEPNDNEESGCVEHLRKTRKSGHSRHYSHAENDGDHNPRSILANTEIKVETMVRVRERLNLSKVTQLFCNSDQNVDPGTTRSLADMQTSVVEDHTLPNGATVKATALISSRLPKRTDGLCRRRVRLGSARLCVFGVITLGRSSQWSQDGVEVRIMA